MSSAYVNNTYIFYTRRPCSVHGEISFDKCPRLRKRDRNSYGCSMYASTYVVFQTNDGGSETPLSDGRENARHLRWTRIRRRLTVPFCFSLRARAPKSRSYTNRVHHCQSVRRDGHVKFRAKYVYWLSKRLQPHYR